MPDRPHYCGHRNRLRKRYQSLGVEGLAGYEFLELLLSYAIPRRDVKPLAKALLARFKTLKGVLDAGAADLRGVRGVGDYTVSLLRSLRDVVRRYFEEEARGEDLVGSPEAVLALCRARLEGEKNEIFEVLHLNVKNRLIGTERLTEGTIDRAAVFPRRVVEGALKARAASLVFVHNHPSGDTAPSAEDRLLTEALVRAAGSVDIRVLDHIIVGRGCPFSFRSHGLMNAQ